MEDTDPKNDNLENEMNDSLSGRENFNSSFKSYNANENQFDNNYSQSHKTTHPKIFTTTVIEKKKNINFKVIKNKEKEQNLLNISSQNPIKNNFDKNNKIINKNNEYFLEETNNGRGGDKIFQNAIINNENKNEYDFSSRSFIDSFLPYNYNKMKHAGGSHINLLGQNQYQNHNAGRDSNNTNNTHTTNYKNSNQNNSNNINNNFNVNVRFHSGASSFQINKQPQFTHFSQYSHSQSQSHSHSHSHPQMPMSPKMKKLKQRETFHYIDILINAADKIFKEGTFVIEGEALCGSSSSDISDKSKSNVDKDESFLNENKDKIFCDQIDKISNIEKDIKMNMNYPVIHSNTSNSVSSQVNNGSKEKTTSLNGKQNYLFNLKGKCDNKHCDSHSTRKKIKLIKVRVCKGKLLRLCNKCNEAWINRQYCFYCLAIYFDRDSNAYVDDKEWIQCDSCMSWVTNIE